jgi:hypothetical protein
MRDAASVEFDRRLFTLGRVRERQEPIGTAGHGP